MSKNSTNGQCSRCETLPEKIGGSGRLYLWLPLDHTLHKTHGHLRARGWESQTTRDHCVIVHLEEGRLSDIFTALSEALTGREIADTRALFKLGGDELSVSDIPRTQSLKQLSALGRSGWLLDLLSEQRLTSHFQPIVWVDRPEEVFAQECLLRGVDVNGALISPGKLLEAAKDAGMLFQTDLAARRTAIREALHHNVRSGLFINFTPSSIYDPRFCLRSTVEAIDAAGLLHEKVVFEVTESEEARDVDHLRSIVSYYREQGFKVALDDIGSGYSSLNMIHRLRPDYIKLDMQLIRGVDADPYKAVVARKVLEIAQSLSIETIVEGVETEKELAWAQDQGATYAQGYLIAHPANPPLEDLSRLSGSRGAGGAAMRS